MKLILIILITGFATYSQAQTNKPTRQDIASFTKTTTYLVERHDILNGFNESMKQGLKENWKITPFKTITQEEFFNKKHDSTASFILLTESIFPNDTTASKYTFISIILGGNYESIQNMPEIVSFPIMHSNSENIEVMLLLPAVATFLSKHIELLAERPILLHDRAFRYYNRKRKGVVHSQLLLIKEAQLPKFQNKEHIAEIYPGKVSFVSYSDIAAAISEKREKTAFHLHVGPELAIPGTRSYTIIMSTQGELYYFNHHRISSEDTSNGILRREWRRLKRYRK